jgi:arylsulfatase A-like enzyme
MGAGLRLGALATVLAFLVACTCSGSDEPHAPNVVLIVVDTLRADHMGMYGYERSTTPELDAFAREATVFDRAYAHAPWTKPSMATLFTSLLPHDHAVHDWDHMLRPNQVTLPVAFSRAGYATHAVVSHHAFNAKSNSFHRGFDSFDISPYKDRGSPHHIRSSRQVSDRAVRQLRRAGDEPFFLFLHYFDPHDSYLHSKQFDFGEEEEVDLYDSEIGFTDHHIGRVLRALEAQGLAENTVVAITADHGEEFLDHGHRLHTVTLYDEVLRIPLLVRVPGFKPQVIAHTVGLVDLAPTLVDLAGFAPPAAFAGTSIEFGDKGFTLSEPRAVFAETRRDANKRAVVKGPWKLIEDRHAETLTLFDLERDPGEHSDVGPLYVQQRDSLKAELDGYAGRPDPKPYRKPLDEDTLSSLKELGYLGDE